MNSRDDSGLDKKMKFHYPVGFSPAENEYEYYFLHHVEIFRKFMTNV